MEPIGLSFKDAGIFLGGNEKPLSRTSLYRMLERNQLEGVKINGRTLIMVDSLKAYVANAPRLGMAA